MYRHILAFAAAVLLSGTWLAGPSFGQRKDPSPEQGFPEFKRGGPEAPGKKRAPDAEGDGEGAVPAPPRPTVNAQKKRRSGSSIPETAAKRVLLLDELFALLATAQDEQAAKRTSDVIEQLWLVPSSPTVSVLIERAARAAGEKRVDVAQKLLDSAVKMAPDYPEVFLRRAYLHHSQNDVRSALGDVRRALALEPNHFKALEALGQMLKEIGQQKAALAAFRKLLEVHPFWPGAKAAMDELVRDVEGQET